jgi:hypothetical protein
MIIKFRSLKQGPSALREKLLRSKLEIQGKVDEQAMSLRYLEVEATSNGVLKSEVKHQACKAARLSGCLKNTMYRNKYLRAEPQVRTCV